jgi:hypothetical protein
MIVIYILLASLYTAQSLRPNLTPKTFKDQLSSTTNIKLIQLLPAIATAISITNTPSLAKAAEGKAKSFEYQPALAGLDYGKPRTYYTVLTLKFARTVLYLPEKKCE